MSHQEHFLLKYIPAVFTYPQSTVTALVSPSQASVSACKAADTAVSGTKAGDLIFGCMVEASFYQFSNTPPQSFLGRSTDEYSTSSFSHY